MPEHRIVVHTPVDEEVRQRLKHLRGLADPLVGCPDHARPVSHILAEKAALGAGRTEAARAGATP